jgi:hypothetical protein
VPGLPGGEHGPADPDHLRRGVPAGQPLQPVGGGPGVVVQERHHLAGGPGQPGVPGPGQPGRPVLATTFTSGKAAATRRASRGQWSTATIVSRAGLD